VYLETGFLGVTPVYEASPRRVVLPQAPLDPVELPPEEPAREPPVTVRETTLRAWLERTMLAIESIVHDPGARALVVGHHRILGRLRHALRRVGIKNALASYVPRDEVIHINSGDATVVLCEYEHLHRVHGTVDVAAYEARPNGRWSPSRFDLAVREFGPRVLISLPRGRTEIPAAAADAIVGEFGRIERENAARMGLDASPPDPDDEAASREFVRTLLTWRDSRVDVSTSLMARGIVANEVRLPAPGWSTDWEARRMEFAQEETERTLADPDRRTRIADLLILDETAPDEELFATVEAHNLAIVGCAEVVRALLDREWSTDRDAADAIRARRARAQARSADLGVVGPAAELEPATPSPYRRNLTARRDLIETVLTATGLPIETVLSGAEFSVSPSQLQDYAAAVQANGARWMSLLGKRPPTGRADQALSKSIRSFFNVIGVQRAGSKRTRTGGGQRETVPRFAACEFVSDLARRLEAPAALPAPVIPGRPGFQVLPELETELLAIRASGDPGRLERLRSYQAALGRRDSGFLSLPGREAQWRETSGRIHVGGSPRVPGAAGARRKLGPAFQNVARPLRKYLAAVPGRVIVNFDAANFHMRIAGELSGDSGLLAICEAGDVYGALSTALGVTRAVAKVAALALLNGSQGASLVKEGIAPADAKRLVYAWRAAFPRLEASRQAWMSDWRARGGIVRLPGRDLEAETARGAVALRWLSVEADVLDHVLSVVDREGPAIGLRTLLPLYDGLVADVPEENAPAAEALIRRAFSEACPWGIAKVGVGATWGSAEANTKA
jgi:hypothetical protein